VIFINIPTPGESEFNMVSKESKSRRVVVTGMGVISPSGLNINSLWKNLCAGQSGIRPITLFDTTDFDVRIAGEADGFDPIDFMAVKESRRTDRFVQFAIAALHQVEDQSGLQINDANADQIGAIIGSGVGGIWTYTRELEVLLNKGPRRVNPFLIPSITVDTASVHVSLRTGARGPNFGVGSACATSAVAIGEAYEIIQRGHAVAMFAGGFEAAVTPIGIAAFDRMRALSHRNAEPEKASRPFDHDRDGFVLSEGGAILMLEDLHFALDRGAEPLAEIVGYAGTSDANHITAPDPEGANAALCMALAIERAEIVPRDVDYINAHGTSTPAGDPAETTAIKRAFGDRAYQIPVSSTKSMTGHLLGGAGALETAICVQTLRTNIIPPTINLDNAANGCDLDYVPHVARATDVNVALTNSFGFGGHNVSLVLKTFEN
jgi:3-oxoacyl-[acyl-carrier-protein] synthase II